MSPEVHQRICAPVLSEDGGSFSKTGGSCSSWRDRTWKILRSYKYQKEMLLSLSSIKTFRLFFLEILDFQGEGPEFHSGRTRCILKFLVFPPLFFGSPFPSLGHLPSRSAYILSRAHVQGNLCLCLCFLFGSYTCFAQICGLPRRAGLMSDQDFFEQIRAIFQRFRNFSRV